MVEDKDVQIAATGRDRKVTSLIRIRLEDLLVREQHAAEVMRSGNGGSGGVVIVGSRGNVIVILVVRLWNDTFGGT